MPPLTLKELEQKVLSNPSNTNLNNWWHFLLKENKVFIKVDTREQQPITENEIQIPTRKATLQTGDYVVMVKNLQIPILWERKSLSDFYGTLYGGRDRFYKEIDRAIADEEVQSFIIMCEGSREEFLKYIPNKDNYTEVDYWLKVQSMMNSKKATINALRIRQKVQVIFCDSRAGMVEQFGDMIKQWAIHNFEEVLK
jgi:ERCC4-type nuclease